MGKRLKISFVLALFVAALLVTPGAASGNTRPGWGYGDKNHVHTGPPGHSIRPVQLVKGSQNANVSIKVHGNSGNTNIFVQIINFIGRNIFRA